MLWWFLVVFLLSIPVIVYLRRGLFYSFLGVFSFILVIGFFSYSLGGLYREFPNVNAIITASSFLLVACAWLFRKEEDIRELKEWAVFMFILFSTISICFLAIGISEIPSYPAEGIRACLGQNCSHTIRHYLSPIPASILMINYCLLFCFGTPLVYNQKKRGAEDSKPVVDTHASPTPPAPSTPSASPKHSP